MCEIFLVKSMDKGLNKTDLKQLMRVLQESSIVNKDGFGLFNEKGKVFRRDKFDPALSEVVEKTFDGSKFVVAHTRLATTGVVKKRNSHPFENDDFIWVHNGVLDDDDIKSVPHRVDSEAIGYIISEEMSKGKTFSEGVKEFASKVSGSYSVVIMDKRTGELHYFLNDASFSFQIVKVQDREFITGTTSKEKFVNNFYAYRKWGFDMKLATTPGEFKLYQSLLYKITDQGISIVGDFIPKPRYSYAGKKMGYESYSEASSLKQTCEDLESMLQYTTDPNVTVVPFGKKGRMIEIYGDREELDALFKKHGVKPQRRNGAMLLTKIAAETLYEELVDEYSDDEMMNYYSAGGTYRWNPDTKEWDDSMGWKRQMFPDHQEFKPSVI